MSAKIGVTLFATGAMPEGHAFIEVFHEWIKRRELDELMIDVADYGHVHGGPSVYFCGHESDYAIVRSVTPGLFYRRKRAPASALPAARDGLVRAARVAGKLEREPKLAGLAFDPARFEVSYLDRLHAPNTKDAAVAAEAELRAAIEPIVGRLRVTRVEGDPRRPLALAVALDAPVVWSSLGG
ncbi:MAG: hypothetical protein U0414_36520 [Polyangiaceae bacterium]